MTIPTFLKWAGGKKRLIMQIEPHLPKKINRYFECFLGGGAMFFYIKQKYNPKFCMISDINFDLINTYKDVRDNPIELIKFIKQFKKKNSKEFYYEVRKKFNQNKIKGIKRSAAFIYLNKNCFNGLYRVNLKGEFNVPYANLKNPEIFNKQIILFASKLLQGVKIVCQDYNKLKGIIKLGDFVYLDPCYDPLKKTSFTKYTPKRFTNEENNNLSLFISKLKDKGAKVMLSNNKTRNVNQLYPNPEFNINIIYCSRPINCRGYLRGKIPEVLIRNY